tara:strand:+ start:55 stop:396 length:342 start_codon:yes stop_codon:yes gene_type:complete
MNISTLTDTQLNRAMIWCYPASIYGCYTRDRESTVYWSKVSGVYQAVDYLLNWNLTMPLAVKGSLSIDLEQCFNGHYDSIGYQAWGINGVDAINKNPLRAICEVLVMIKMESK